MGLPRLGGQVLVTIFREKGAWNQRVKTLIVIALAVGIALALAFPLQLDMVSAIKNSTRSHVDSVDFALAARIPFFGQELSSLWNTFALGNPVTRTYLGNVSALNLTPFVFALLMASLVLPIYRRSWLFMGVFVFFLAIAISPALHEVAVRYMGLGFSRGNPVGGL